MNSHREFCNEGTNSVWACDGKEIVCPCELSFLHIHNIILPAMFSCPFIIPFYCKYFKILSSAYFKLILLSNDDLYRPEPL